MGRTRNNGYGHAEGLYGDEFETTWLPAASAAAMKEAMDRAEAKFRHAKGIRERESAKASRSKEAGQLGRDVKAMQDAQERAIRGKRERLEHERQEREREEEEREQRRLERAREIVREREEKEREQRRLEKERERLREIERGKGKARQAVERATKEAQRAAVHRAQVEARERATAEAKERAERLLQKPGKGQILKQERRKHVRELLLQGQKLKCGLRTGRAAADSRERAAAAARVNQQKNENDLESFFSMGSRPSSAPRPRANSSMRTWDCRSAFSCFACLNVV
ncbi:hypothetical protein CK203_113055 [Vitis vinifera]|uniref:Uncharacterized protein n=1 Tax=Vitis vinifera TaxID=29760 RepID=A0A438FG53_VITVI|nr:hypothetical protein CK203_113055 [Vitis vinifera]